MTIFTVSSQAQLDSAVTQLKSGDTLQLAAGTYSLTMTSKAFTSAVTVTSLDPANPARLGGLKLTDTSNVTFKNLEVGRSLSSTEGIETTLTKVSNGGNIVFDTVRFRGSLDGNPTNDGIGIAFGGVRGVTITNSEFEQLGRGATFGACSNITILNNKFHDIRSDGLNFVAVDHVTIDGNSFTNFQRITSDHPDAIQFWTANSTRPSTDIVIRNNVILEGSGTGLQGIFMRDDVGGLPYERVTIENNVVYNQNMSNGITVMGGKDITIRYNTVLGPTDDTVPVWIRAENIVGGTITKNLTDRFYTATNTSLTITDNLMTSQSGLSSSLLSLNNLANVSAAQLLVSGYGYTAPSTTTSGGSTTTGGTGTTTGGTTTGGTTTDGGGTTSGGTTTTTKPGKGRAKKGAITSKVAVDAVSSDYSAYSFSATTLSDSLPEVQSSYGSLSTGSTFTASSGSGLIRSQRTSRTSAAEAFVAPNSKSGTDYRLALLAGH